MAYLWVFVGGGFGACLRVAAGHAAATLTSWPSFYATLAVNLAGSFAIGLAAGLLPREPSESALSPLLIAGLLGGFTTFSAFSLDNLRLAESHRWPELGANILIQVGGGLALVAAGHATARLLGQR